MQLDLQVNKNDYKISKVVKYDGSISFTLTPKKRNCKGCGKSFESNGTEFICWNTKDGYSVSGWFCKRHLSQARKLIKETR